jgi:uncharacterized protein (DUF58 family)
MTMLALTAILFLWSRFAISGLSFSRTIQPRAQVGDDVTENLSLRNRSLIGKLFVEIDDRSTLPGHLANRVVSIGGHTRRDWSVTTTVQQRGLHVLGPAVLRSGDPLGFFRRELRSSNVAEILVYPLLVELPDYTPSALLQSGGGKVHRRSAVPTAAVGGVREYTPGDSINVISWTSTARAGRLMVKEFEIDPTADAWIVLDLSGFEDEVPRPTYSSVNPIDWLGSPLEYRIMLANSLAKQVLSLGRSVGLLTNAGETSFLPPDRSDRQYRRIRDALAIASQHGSTLAEAVIAISPRLRSNTALLVISSRQDLELSMILGSLKRRRISSEIFHVKRGSEDDCPSPEYLERLAAFDIPFVQLSHQEHPLVALRSTGSQVAHMATYS